MKRPITLRLSLKELLTLRLTRKQATALRDALTKLLRRKAGK